MRSMPVSSVARASSVANVVPSGRTSDTDWMFSPAATSASHVMRVSVAPSTLLSPAASALGRAEHLSVVSAWAVAGSAACARDAAMMRASAAMRKAAMREDRPW